MATITKLKNWGSSLGVVIPSEIIKEKNLKEGEKVVIEINKKENIKNLFGSLKDWKIDTQKLKNELRKEWDK